MYTDMEVSQMAQTKSRTKARTNHNQTSQKRSSGSTRSSNSTGRNASRSGANAVKKSGTATRARSAAGSSRKRAAETSRSAAQNAAGSVAGVARKAAVPLLAGGAAVAGLAGAAVIGARSSRRRKVLGVRVPKRRSLSMPTLRRNGFKGEARNIAKSVSHAAQRADQFGQRVSRVASGVQNVSDTADDAVKKA
jgi:hypothetical protein